MYMTMALLSVGGGQANPVLPHHESKGQACTRPYWVGS